MTGATVTELLNIKIDGKTGDQHGTVAVSGGPVEEIIIHDRIWSNGVIIKLNQLPSSIRILNLHLVVPDHFSILI